VVSLFSLFFGAVVLLFPMTFTTVLAASHPATEHSAPQPAAIDRIGDSVQATEEDDEEEDDELEVGGDYGDHGSDSELLYPNAENEDEDEDKDYSHDDRYT
jgi:hypothetical protein